jgi:hypothetical protein
MKNQTNKKTKSRYAVVADLLRTGHSTPELVAEYETLDAQQRANARPQGGSNWWDSPVAARMWKRDGRDIER